VSELDFKSSLEFIKTLSPEDKEKLSIQLQDNTRIWVPLPGPQTKAFDSEADILLYGGAAGGGKSDLLIGLGLTEHLTSIFFRREGTQAIALIDRVAEILGNRNGFNGADRIWREEIEDKPRQIEFGSCPALGDEIKYQGRPHDLIGFDEITHFLEHQFRFLMGWLRSVREGQRCRVVCTGNPPTDKEGEWVIQYWAPWLDKTHPNPALPGELRWFVTLDGRDMEVVDGTPFEWEGEVIKPMSRTFIPSNVDDNPFLSSTGYKQVLQGLPEPLRSQMLMGDFLAGVKDDAWQAVPTELLMQASKRDVNPLRNYMPIWGLDVARFGDAKTALVKRWANTVIESKIWDKRDTMEVAGLIKHEFESTQTNMAPSHICVDVIGVGAGVVDRLLEMGLPVMGVNVGEPPNNRELFQNLKAELWWECRSWLEDPQTVLKDKQLIDQLRSVKFGFNSNGKIRIESKLDLVKRGVASPDIAEAFLLTLCIHPQKREARYNRKKDWGNKTESYWTL
jgi:hypothetical protein